MVGTQRARYKKQKPTQANLSKGVSQLRLHLAACKRKQTQCLTKRVYASDIKSSEDDSPGWCNCFLMLSENNVPTRSCLLLHDSSLIFSLCLHSWQEEEDCESGRQTVPRNLQNTCDYFSLTRSQLITLDVRSFGKLALGSPGKNNFLLTKKRKWAMTGHPAVSTRRGIFLVKIQRAILWAPKNMIQAQPGFLRDGAELADEELVC